ncbi:hypothetical protein [Acidiphilium acidophilum]|uniref:Uncharacterized protein n=1 Tax=Acidiphilium acidophilum TaxID=76588 RepID=A0AAW9DRY2_ACIAO|nr:hypothetical protein [Acidiphilium acidophilum]MDX5931839.1 hypothetical protein [Acidiphilium acidophilum]
MTDHKTQADAMHDRIIGNLENQDRRTTATISLPVADLRRAIRSLASRGDQILARRDRDPILRAAAEAEAGHCRRVAAALDAAMKKGAAQ